MFFCPYILRNLAKFVANIKGKKIGRDLDIISREFISLFRLFVTKVVPIALLILYIELIVALLVLYVVVTVYDRAV